MTMTPSTRQHSRSSSSRSAKVRSGSEPTDSEVLRSECAQLIERLFPDSAKPGDCSPGDVNNLIAVFHRDRFAQRAKQPRLPLTTRIDVSDKLVAGNPFHSEAGLVNIRRYLTLLGEAFQSLISNRPTEEPLDCVEWYAEISKWDGTCARVRRKCPSGLQVEFGDVAFYLKHCHYLLISIEDSHNLTERPIDHIRALSDRSLNGYANQWVSAKENLFTLICHQRSRGKWHELYMELEEKCFDAYAMGIDENESAVLEVVKRIEVETIVYIRTKLEDELTRDGYTAHSHGVRQMFRTVVGQAGRQIVPAGLNEESAEYFKYGILDLMYQCSFWVHNRVGCFEEMIGAIHLVLERSHRSGNLLHRKAVDLYHRINELGIEDHKVYGRLEERESIEDWIGGNKDVETLEDSRKYFPIAVYVNLCSRWKRAIEERKEIRAHEERIKVLQLQARTRQLSSIIPNLELRRGISESCIADHRLLSASHGSRHNQFRSIFRRPTPQFKD